LLRAVRSTPDAYLDELQDMLAASCGRSVSRATVWRVLHRAGFTLKKVCDLLTMNPTHVSLSRSRKSLLSVPLKSDLNIWTELADTVQISLSL
jgi:hypothetical protein